MKKFSKKLKKGFTLVELVVVIAIIAILSAASVATYFGVTESARKSTSKSNAQQVAQLIYVEALSEFGCPHSWVLEPNWYTLVFIMQSGIVCDNCNNKSISLLENTKFWLAPCEHCL